MWDQNVYDPALDALIGCSASSSSMSMEVLDQEHFSGVLKVLHAAKSGRLRTDRGVIEVAPRPNSRRDGEDDRYLFELELMDRPPAALDALEFEELELDFGDAVFSLEGTAVRQSKGRLFVSRPRRLFSKGLANIIVSAGLVRLRWSVGKLVAHAEVLEISMDEILIEGPGPSIMPGRPRPVIIEFYEHDREQLTEIRCTVDVRSGDRRPACARLLLSADEDRGGLVRLYRLLRFPQLVDRGSVDRHEVVDLFERSRYLSLRETEQVTPSDAWCCPDFASNLSIDTIYRADDGSLLGHVSVTRAYSKTWLGHQLATLKGHPESAASRHALYRHFACAPLLSDGEDCFLLGYYDRHLRWHQLFFESFVDWVGDANQAVVLEFDRFEPLAGVGDEYAGGCPDTVTVEPLHRLDVEAAVQLIASQLPALAARAFDIDVAHLQSDALHPDYGARGVDRTRKVFVLHEAGELVGVALCETGSRHLSLFNLLNMGQVYLMPGRTSRTGRAILLSAARNFYRARGITDPVLVAPPRSFDHPEDVGLKCEETMGCIIWSGQSLLQYQSFISYCFAKIGTNALTSESAVTTRGTDHGAPSKCAPRATLSSSRDHGASAHHP
jgi:hypothetical protein